MVVVLPGPVRADQRDDLGFLDLDRDVGHGLDPSIVDGHVDAAQARPSVPLIRHPQVSGDDSRVVADLGGQALGDLLAELQHHDPVGHTHDQPHVVLDQQHRVAVVADLADEPHELVLLRRVEARRRLVQAEQLRLGGQRPGDLQPALVAVGQVLRLVGGAVGDAHELQQRHRALDGLALLAVVPRHPQQRAEHTGPVPGVGADHHVLQRRHLAEEPDVLERPRDARPGDLVLLRPAERLVLQQHLTRRRPVHAGHGVEAGRLARAVRPDQAEDLAAPDVEGHRVHRDQTTEAHGDVAQFEQGVTDLDGDLPIRRDGLGDLGLVLGALCGVMCSSSATMPPSTARPQAFRSCNTSHARSSRARKRSVR